MKLLSICLYKSKVKTKKLVVKLGSPSPKSWCNLKKKN